MGHREAFGYALRERRKALSMSQDDLSHQASVDRTYISIIELGRKSPTLDVILRLATALNTTPSALIKRMEDLSSPETLANPE